MHLLATASIVIECPASKAFDYVADLTNFSRWFPGVVGVRPRDQLAHATIGKTYEETFRMPLRRTKSVVIRVAEADAPRRFATEGALPPLLPRMEIEIRNAGSAGCEVHWRMLSRNNTAWVRWTLLPLARLAMRKRAAAAMPRLKKLLESGPDR